MQWLQTPSRALEAKAPLEILYRWQGPAGRGDLGADCGGHLFISEDSARNTFAKLLNQQYVTKIYM